MRRYLLALLIGAVIGYSSAGNLDVPCYGQFGSIIKTIFYLKIYETTIWAIWKQAKTIQKSDTLWNFK